MVEQERKKKIIANVCENLLKELEVKFEYIQYKYSNNTKIFDSEDEYLKFCREQIYAATLENISKRISNGW